MELENGAKVFIKNKKLDKYLFVLRDDKPDIPYPNCWSLIGGGYRKRRRTTRSLNERSKRRNRN